ncbi:MAG: sulfite exporter TauE/SafE family protein [Deltaproteobacteria bacterium]|nr:sulfite exporter TauE/SafE family protein [Deltaproteobacteria bacterium]
MDLLQVIFPVAGVKTYVFIPPVVAFVISFFTSMAGISGAFLLLPFQMNVLGFTTTSVTSTNFLFNVTGTPGGIYRYIKECRFAWPVALIIVAGIIPGVLVGYYIRIKFLPDPKSFKLFVGFVLLFVALKLIKDSWAKNTGGQENSCNLNDRVNNVALGLKKTRFDFRKVTHSFFTGGMLGLAFIVGIVGGVYGIGGGSIIAPFLITFFKLPVYAIAGAVLLGTFASSVAGVAFYSIIPLNGEVAPPDWMLGILFGAGGLLGMYFGAKMQKYVSEKWIKLILGIIVFIIASGYVLKFFIY